MIDSDGFRFNVGIIVFNDRGQLLWARRVGQKSWQFPQGGLDEGESAEQALYRELNEEVGLSSEDVEIVAQTDSWLPYTLPKRYQRFGSLPLCIGQKQKWFLLYLRCSETHIDVKHHSPQEFDGWRWVSYWYPLSHVISFKRDVYQRALAELSSPMIQFIENGLQDFQDGGPEMRTKQNKGA
ncbi:MAG: RNA pyrophosphohydrolase [Pseudomonadales bacterium]|nr:RNA pyrophosphohydrolase [Pseudomonadales bacterium]